MYKVSYTANVIISLWKFTFLLVFEKFIINNVFPKAPNNPKTVTRITSNKYAIFIVCAVVIIRSIILGQYIYITNNQLIIIVKVHNTLTEKDNKIWIFWFVTTDSAKSHLIDKTLSVTLSENNFIRMSAMNPLVMLKCNTELKRH